MAEKLDWTLPTEKKEEKKLDWTLPKKVQPSLVDILSTNLTDKTSNYNVNVSGVQPTIPEKKLDWTIPEKPKELDWTLPKEKYGYKEFVDDLRKTQSGFIGGMKLVKERVGEIASGDTTNLGRTLFTPMLAYDALERFKKSFQAGEYNTAKELFKEIPDGKTKSLIGNMAINTPKEIMEVSTDFITDPTIYILGAMGKPVRSILKLAGANPYVKKAVEKLKDTPAGKKALEWLVYRGGQPEKYVEEAESRLLKISQAKEEAKKVGVELSEGLSKGEQQRLGQIIGGSESVSEREATLRQLAKQPREIIDNLEKEAQMIKLRGEQTLLPEITYKTKLTRKQINVLRTEKDKIYREINDALGKTKQAKLQGLVADIDIKGIDGLRKRWVTLRNEIMASKDESVAILEKELGTNIDTFLTRIINLSKVNKKIAVANLEKFANRAMTIANKTGSGRMEQLSDSLFEFMYKVSSKKDLAKIAEITNKTRMGMAENLFKKAENINRGLYNKVLDLAEGMDNIKINGIKPLIDELSKEMRFKGRAKVINSKLDKIAELDKRIQTSYKHGGEKYVPRMMKDIELEKQGMVSGQSKPTRVRGERFIKRETAEQSGLFIEGQIREPSYPVAKGIVQVSHDIETAKFFGKVASNPEWTSAFEKPGYVLMPESKKLGELSGKWVTESIAKDINEINKPIEGVATQLYNKFMGAWKFSKTVANPATHFRNVMSNSIMADQAGIDHVQQIGIFRRLAKDFVGKKRYFNEVKDTGFLGKEFSQVEIKDFLGDISKPSESFFGNIVGATKEGMKKLSSIYQTEEQAYKMMTYVHFRDLGLSVKDAIKMTEKYQFNYEKVAKVVEWARKSPVGAPFATFVSKALPMTAKTAVTHPERLYKYIAMFKAIENQTKDHLGLSDEELNDIKASKRGVNVVLPFVDKNGDYQTLDISYILPWGDIGEQGGNFGLSPSMSPFSTPVSKAVIELSSNKSTYTGKPLWQPGDDKTKKIIEYFERNLIPVPTWMPGIAGGYSWNKVLSAIKERPDFYGRTRGLSKVLLDVIMGVKISPVDIAMIKEQETKKMDRDIRDIESHIRYVGKNQSISQKEKEKDTKRNIESIKKIIENKKTINEALRIFMGGGQ